jgi:hypothetical protein
MEGFPFYRHREKIWGRGKVDPPSVLRGGSETPEEPGRTRWRGWIGRCCEEVSSLLIEVDFLCRKVGKEKGCFCFPFRGVFPENRGSPGGRLRGWEGGGAGNHRRKKKGKKKEGKAPALFWGEKMGMEKRQVDPHSPFPGYDKG